MTRALLLLVALVALVSVAHANGTCPTNVTRADINLVQYMGSWFELATNPSSLRTFEKGCYCTQATYTLQPTGLVQVNNTCRIGAVNGTVYTVVGTGRIPTPGYLVVFVDPEYRVAVVWSCEEFVPFMWILSRTPTVPDAVYSFLLVKAQELTGYDVSKLVRTVQQGCMY